MTAAPTVSVVIPVHNGERYLAEAIESVLEQSHPALECIVVDDGSTDSTAAVAGRYGDRVRFAERAHAGVSAARNLGTSLARGELVAFLDHDDSWLADKLERQLALVASAGALLTLCAVQVVDASGRPLRVLRLQWTADLVTGMLLFDGTETVSCSSAGLFDRAGLEAIGGFDESLSTSDDWDMLLRCALTEPPAYIDCPLVRYRVHDANMSHRIELMEADMRRAFDKAFADPRLPSAVRDDPRRAYARLYRMLAGSYRDAGRPSPALRALTRAVIYDPRLALELVWRRCGRVS